MKYQLVKWNKGAKYTSSNESESGSGEHSDEVVIFCTDCGELIKTGGEPVKHKCSDRVVVKYNTTPKVG